MQKCPVYSRVPFFPFYSAWEDLRSYLQSLLHSYQFLYLLLKLHILCNARALPIVAAGCNALLCQLTGLMREYAGVYYFKIISSF